MKKSNEPILRNWGYRWTGKWILQQMKYFWNYLKVSLYTAVFCNEVAFIINTIQIFLYIYRVFCSKIMLQNYVQNYAYLCQNPPINWNSRFSSNLDFQKLLSGFVCSSWEIFQSEKAMSWNSYFYQKNKTQILKRYSLEE